MSGIRLRPTSVLGLAALALTAPLPTRAQEAPILRAEATPVGALPPLALPMPASRNHNYWGVRLQSGIRSGRDGGTLTTYGGGIDLQWRGGSVFGATAGYQEPSCATDATDCEGHPMFGLRARFNVITGGPTLARLVGDYSATSTLGAEMGMGYAPGVQQDLNACTFDLGMPLSIAMLQRVRLVTYAMPSLVWDFDCGGRSTPELTTWMMNAGIGVQQLGLRGLDVYLGMQKIFRDDTGYLFGITATYLRLP